MKELIIELIKFFKNNLFKILIGMVLIASPYIWLNSRTDLEDTENIDDVAIDDVAILDENQEISAIETNANPASFSFFAEHVDGYPFSNNAILASYIKTPNILRDVEQETGTQIIDVIQNTDNTIYFKSEDATQMTEMRVLGVSKTPNEHLNELYVNIGNEEDNLKIVNYFYEAIINNEIPLLDDKNVYIFQEPQILEIEANELEANEKLEISEDTAVKTADPFGTTIIVGGALGLIVILIILIVAAFFSKKLYYLFTYSIRENDSFLLVDNNLEYGEELDFLLNSPTDSENIVITEVEDSISNDAINSKLNRLVSSKNITKVNNIFEIKDFTNVGRLIYIIEEGQTKRSWYNKQRRYDDFYNLPTVLVQINKNQQDNIV